MTDWIASSETGFFKPGELTSYDPAGVGLCFSGGGYRATLFHAGVVIRLNQLGVLPRLDRVSSVSGGSITSGILAQAWNRLAFDSDGVASAASIEQHFIVPILKATSRTLDVGVGFAGFLPFVSAGNRLATLYDRHVFDGMMLGDLPQRPKFIFNATNLQTGGLFRFTRTYLADWRALMSTTRSIRVADAVAASSAFPPVLAPLRLDLRDEDVVVPPGARFDDPELQKEPILVDGGCYDNLGLEPIWKRCGVLISSYAGHNAAADPGNFSIDHMVPVINTFLSASIDWRERVLFNLLTNALSDGRPERMGAFWNADTDITAFPLHDGWKPDAAGFERARDTPTRLQALSLADQRTVIEAGFAYADAGMRSFLLPDAAPASGPPNLP